MTKFKRRTFTKQYKAEVVDPVRQSGGNAAQVARNIELTPQTVAAWVRQAVVDAGDGRPEQLTTADKAELTALRKEVEDLRIEREFVKISRSGSRGSACEICSNR